jgi:hypothetical protein
MYYTQYNASRLTERSLFSRPGFTKPTQQVTWHRHVWHLNSHSDWLMKIVRAVFSQRQYPRCSARTEIFRVRREYKQHHSNQVEQFSANATFAFAVGFAFVFAFSIKGPLAQVKFAVLYLVFQTYEWNIHTEKKTQENNESINISINHDSTFWQTNGN